MGLSRPVIEALVEAVVEAVVVTVIVIVVEALGSKIRASQGCCFVDPHFPCKFGIV